jgi:hypothetical protein
MVRNSVRSAFSEKEREREREEREVSWLRRKEKRREGEIKIYIAHSPLHLKSVICVSEEDAAEVTISTQTAAERPVHIHTAHATPGEDGIKMTQANYLTESTETHQIVPESNTSLVTQKTQWNP